MFGRGRRSRFQKSKVNSQQRNKLSRTFEALEDRRLLTIFNVTTVADLVNPSDGKLSLREAIDLANAHPGADVIVLKAGPSAYKITIAGGGEDNNQTGDFDITEDLTIKSAGSGFPTIGGNGLDRVFDIPSGNDGVSLTLNHVIVTGGVARGNGGGVAGESESNTLTFINTTIKNNITTSPGGGRGGGVYSNSGEVALINSHVDNNSAAAGVTGFGGGIYIDLAGGITIKNSTVNSNSAYSEGGGVYIEVGTVFNVTNSQINNNHSGDGGGGGADFKSETPITITGSTFSGNTTSGEGGAINSRNESPFTITGSNFKNNSAVGDGGAIWTDIGAISVTNSTFANNTSTGGIGGALANTEQVDVTGSTFNHNVAQGIGGAIAQGEGSPINIKRSTFTKNASVADGGGAIWDIGSRSLTVTDSKFTFNSALNNGGAILANGAVVSVLRSTFDHNTSTNGQGGAIDGGEDPTDIGATNSNFTYNTAKADGGALNSEGGIVNLDHCLVSCNTATNGQGGGFAAIGTSGVIVQITNSTIDGNTAGGNGGGFSVIGFRLGISDSTVSNNRSGSDGGGMYVATVGLSTDGAASTIVNCTISGNGAADAGGGIDFEGQGDLIIYFATIVFNATDHGGGIAQTDGLGTIQIGNTIVAKNIANTGPDAYNATAQPFDDLGHNLVFADPDSVFSDPNSDDIFGLAPLLGPLANNGGPTKTHALLKGSPAINAADGTLLGSPIAVDQRGFKRPVGPVPAPDIGAFEKQ